MIRKILLTLCLVLGFTSAVHAQSDTFSVTQFINSDFTPPTTPGSLTATTTESDRMYLSWDASTDDFLFSGYQVFRDGSQIATTSLTNYIDVGLAPSTTYAYYIVAFDFVRNYSSSSNVAIATTTGALPEPEEPEEPPETPRSSPSPTQTVVLMRDFTIEPTTNTALLSWLTNRPVRYELRWGQTKSYELGFVASQVPQYDHTTLIDGLEPNTVYEYELIAFDRGGNMTELVQDRFRTIAQPDTTPPPNIANFRAVSDGADVRLTWQNPTGDFAYVRIVRNPFFYPRDPNDGYVVFQGVLESVIDRRALEQLNDAYYTAFVYDPSGNRSSGALAYAKRFSEPDAAGEAQPETTPDPQKQTEPAAVQFTLSINDIRIIQDNEVIAPVSGSFLVDTSRPFTVHAPYDLFPEHLKIIQLSLQHPVDPKNEQLFLLRINNDKTAYQATIAHLGYTGTIPLQLIVYDFSTRQMAEASGSIITKNSEPDVIFIKDRVGTWYLELWWVLLLVLLVLFWLLIARRRRKTEDKRSVRFR